MCEQGVVPQWGCVRGDWVVEVVGVDVETFAGEVF